MRFCHENSAKGPLHPLKHKLEGELAPGGPEHIGLFLQDMAKLRGAGEGYAVGFLAGGDRALVEVYRELWHGSLL